MYVDYEILKTLKEHDLSMGGKELIDSVISADKLIFSKKVLDQMIADGLIRGSMDTQCTMTPKGALRFLELELQREEKEEQKRQVRRNTITAWIAIAVSVLGLIVSSLLAIIS